MPGTESSVSIKRQQQGKIIRISHDIETFLNKRRKKEELNASYDSLLRKHFGLNTIKGLKQPLQTLFIVFDGKMPLVFMKRSEARGMAVQIATMNGKQKADAIMEVREVP